MSEAAGPDALLLDIEGFQGPLDVLLELARAQKVDIRSISILSLVDQYLAVIEGARGVRIELAADWLVMAAWLAWLKSRLLLPEEERGPDEEDPLLAAARLTERLAELDRMRAAAEWLGRRAQLGRETFARGAPESLRVEDRTGLVTDLTTLLRAYAAARRRAVAARPFTPRPRKLWSVAEALGRLRALLGDAGTGWSTLGQFLPPDMLSPLDRRAAMASTLVAALEAARGGAVELRQDTVFGPIHLRKGEGELPHVA
ncbi:segregation and condensation protein A [Roseococcus suduntuyensis]|uniref:Segregation and condensation protein A n=1 Tax=Roseococcus suduntuyensis TaxID=455361 RepID=A0A840AG71_9PROT|nr:ScpA family protein [Roseococcus suduntuyensis]MBB3899085.1 segregation and condensation protein A [Roseococcus suduntuyensis]